MSANININKFAVTLSSSFTSGMAWLIVFIPAFAYFVSTRMLLHHQSGLFGVEMGVIVTDTMECYHNGNNDVLPSSECCPYMKNIFYLNTITSSCRSGNITGDDADLQPFVGIKVSLKHALMNVQTAKTTPISDNVNLHDSKLSSLGGSNNPIVDMQWIHDDALGRGYLLYSMENRIWRWEKGGGPIPIGRTLHLDNAGCRSGLYRSCDYGSGRKLDDSASVSSSSNDDHTNGMVGAISIQQTKKSKNYKKVDTNDEFSKSLTIAEWGEGRVIRLESETGARTPLIIEIPDPCLHQQSLQLSESSSITRFVRLSHNPKRMTYTPDGDLLVIMNTICKRNFSDAEDDKDSSTDYYKLSSIVQLRNAVHVDPVPSLQMSRVAHSWTSVHMKNMTANDAMLPTIWFNDDALQEMNDIVISPTGDAIYTTVRYNDGSVAIMEVSLLEEDDEDDEKTKSPAVTLGSSITQGRVLFNMTAFYSSIHDSHGTDPLSSQRHSHHNRHEVGDIVLSQSGTIFVSTKVLNENTSTSRILVLKSIDNGKNKTIIPLAYIPIVPQDDGNGEGNSSITALELGTDGYLYVAVSTQHTGNSLYRIRTKEKRIM